MSPRSQEQIEIIRAQSITNILDAAYRVMAQKGYEATSIAQIATEASISKGLMYNYFNSKEALLKALIDRTLGEGDQLMTELVSEDHRATLRNIFGWFFNELRNNLEQWRFISELMLKADRFAFIKELVQNKMYEYVGFMAMLLEKMGYERPKEEAQLLAGLFDGIGFQYLVLGKEYPLDEMENFLIDKYCNHE